jgi:hypothetical protein
VEKAVSRRNYRIGCDAVRFLMASQVRGHHQALSAAISPQRPVPPARIFTEERAALAAARNRRGKHIAAIPCIFVGGIGVVGLKIGISELWREHELQKSPIKATATVVSWQTVRGKSSTSCSVSYQFTAHNGDIVNLFLAGATTGIENRIVLDDPATAKPEERRQLEGKAGSRCAD